MVFPADTAAARCLSYSGERKYSFDKLKIKMFQDNSSNKPKYFKCFLIISACSVPFPCPPWACHDMVYSLLVNTLFQK